jgi:DNA-binding NarL/FixJ family response regulator
MAARILIVDDDLSTRTTIRSLLHWHGFQGGSEAKDRKEAIEKITESKPDIVLLDINMPGMNGVKAGEEIRRISPKTKIVFLTTHDAPEVVSASPKSAHEFVPKSAVGTDLIPTLDRLLGISLDGSTKSRRSTTA